MTEAAPPFARGGGRGFGANQRGSTPVRGRGRGSKNKHWPPASGPDNERWERDGHRGGGRGRGRGRGNLTATFAQDNSHQLVDLAADEDLENETEAEEQGVDGELGLDATQEERDEFWRKLVKAREAERKKAIAEGAMDDPLVPKRLEDAITMVGTCMDMCPRFERYRRERESNLTEFEVIPGTKRVNHRRAVKMYERAAGDKTIPSDLRPPLVLKQTLDYLFHVLLEAKGLSAAHNFIRDRSRAVRADFTMQHEVGPLAIECHDRCARYHILAIHFLGGEPSFLAQEDQLLMNTLQSLKEFYEDQRGKLESPTELEMRVYHRLIHIRDQKERHDDIPHHILDDPVFTLITKFRQHVQEESAPITKVSPLRVGDGGMALFAQLAQVLREQNNTVMVYLIACILERLFGKGAIQDDLELIRGDLSISDVIDGVSLPSQSSQGGGEESFEEIDADQGSQTFAGQADQGGPLVPTAPDLVPPQISSVFGETTPSPFGAIPKQDPDPVPPRNAFSVLVSSPSPFAASSVFGGTASTSVFGGGQYSSVFGQPAFGTAPLLPGKPQELTPQSHQSNGSTSSRTLHSPFPHQTVQSAPSTTKAESSSTLSLPNTVPELSQPHPPLSEMVPLPSKVPLNPSAPVFSPQKSPLPALPIPSNLPPKITQPVPPHTFSTPEFPPSSSSQPAESFFHSPTPHLEESQAISATQPTERRQTLWDVPGTSRPRRPPRINTDLTSNGSTSSPKVPPLLKKAETISLPPTTPHTPPSARPSFKGNKFLKGFYSIQNIQTPADILSPLNLTPSINAQEFSFTIPAPQQPDLSETTEKLNSITTKEGKVEGETDKEKNSQWISEAKENATRFKCRGVLVKNCFSRWKQRLMDRVEYLEAVRRSDEYSKKLQTERELSASVSISSCSGGDKKRRISGMSPDSAQRKRARKRLSAKYTPQRTQDELVRRLQENHEENGRRWAVGTFTRSLRERLQRERLPSNWLVWLSINQDNDGTAIWLQRKFDVPSSGTWLSNNIFQIGPTPSNLDAEDGGPGMIIFECTPFEDLDDELEKKYRILDDCARLREILIALPEGRHFLPSLLFILWSEREPSVIGPDLQEMVSCLVTEGILRSFSTFTMSTSMKDADIKFLDALSSAQLDVEGELAVRWTGSTLMRSLSTEWTENLSEWTESCLVDGRVDWASYGEVLQASSRIMDSITYHVTALSKTKVVHLPILVAENIEDSKSASRAIISWLDDPVWLRVSNNVLISIQSYEASGVDFSITDFSSQLPQLLSATLGIACGRAFHTNVYVVKEEYEGLIKRFRDQLRNENDALVESRAMRNSRLLFKRPLPPTNGSESQSSSKRARVRTPSPSLSFVEEPPSPSSRSSSVAPSTTLKKSTVTLDMLRDLTKSVMKSYQA